MYIFRLFFFLFCSFSLTSVAQHLQHFDCSHAKHASKQSEQGEQGADDYDVHHYAFDIELLNTTTEISGTVNMHATVAKAPMDTFWVQLYDNMVVYDLQLNGNKYTNYTHKNNCIKVPLENPIPVGETIVSSITYGGMPVDKGYFSGMRTGTHYLYPVQVTWTLSEPFGAKEWFPVKEDLIDKIDSVSMKVTTISPNMVGSNGLLKRVVDLPDNKKRYEWETHYPMAFYLIAVAVAPYRDYSFYAYPEGTSDSILVQNFIYDVNNPDTGKSYFEEQKYFIDQTKWMLEVFSDRYGLYPFIDEKYGHMNAPMGGGMEHQTMTTQDDYFIDLSSHELGHQWWGDYVTCARWNDIWLNEGFATYSSFVFLEASNPPGAASFIRYTQEKAMELNEGSVFVPSGSDVSRIFNSTLSYRKGASVVHMIRYLLGDEAFFDFLKTYRQTYAFSNATTEDFFNLLESYSGLDMTAFKNEWIYGEGYPSYHMFWNKEGSRLHARVVQESSATATDHFSIPVPLVYYQNGEAFEWRVSADSELNTIEVAGKIDSLKFDPESWILKSAASRLIKHNSLGESANVASEQLAAVYPIPATNFLNFEFVEATPVLIEIFDIHGSALGSYNVSEQQKISLPVVNLQAGWYWYRITINGSTTSGAWMRM